MGLSISSAKLNENKINLIYGNVYFILINKKTWTYIINL